MILEITSDNINIFDNIKTISDSVEIKQALELFDNVYLLKVNIYGISITSSVIGSFVYYQHKYENIQLNIYDKNLYKLLEDLNLIETLNVYFKINQICI
jgi:Na+/H+ antiporter NhaC